MAKDNISQIDVVVVGDGYAAHLDVYLNGEKLLRCKEITVIDNVYRVSNRIDADITASYDVPSDRVRYENGILQINNPRFDEKVDSISYGPDGVDFNYPEMGTIKTGRMRI